MMALRAYISDAWVAAGAYEKVRESRFLLRALVSLMASAGITPELEVETLTPAQVAEAVDSNGRPGLRVAIRDARGSASHRGSFGRGSMTCGLSSTTCVRC